MKISRNVFLVLGICCGTLVVASAALFAGYNYFTDKPVNVLESCKNDCPNIRWMHPVDSSQWAYPVVVQGEVYFAGERVPLEDPDVKERLEHELTINYYWHSNTLLSMKMANRYFGEVEAVLKKNDVPSDFKYLALIESGFKLESSPAGAVGSWQLLKGTAKEHGLVVNDEVDERYNNEKSTEAACAYLKAAKEKLGNWTLAAASYNLGLPGMLQRVKDQNTSNYYDMYFNPETSRYIFRMIAMKIIFSNPKEAGYIIQPEELYQPYKYKIAEIDSSIGSISDFASQFGLKYKHIKMLNPWLRNASLVNKEHKKYEVKILNAN